MKFSMNHFKDLTTKDLYQFLKLRCQVFIVEQTCIYPDIDGKDLDAFHLLVKDPDLVAYLRILKPGVSYKEASIGRVLVKETHRGRHLGHEMMTRAIKFMKENDMMPIRISAQAYLRTFYENLGFEVVSDTYLEDGIEHVEMFMNC